MVSIVIRAEGQTWSGFTDLTVTESMDAPFTTLSLSTTDRQQEGLAVWNVRDGSFIEVLVDGLKVFEGDVNKYNVVLGARNHTITIGAASRAKDMVECSHVGQLNFKGGSMSPEEIVTLIAKPFGVEVVFGTTLSGLELDEKDLSYNIGAGTAAFSAIQRIAEKDGLTVYTDRNFKLAIDDGSSASVHTPLTTGDFTNLTTDHDIGRAHSEVIIKSQYKHTFDPISFQSESANYNDGTDTPNEGSKTGKKLEFAEAQRTQVGFNNTAQTRHRPLLFVNNEKTSSEEVYATYVAQRFAGQSVSARLTLKSLYDGNGEAWALANLVPITEPLASLNDTLIISGKTISVSPDAGLSVNLTLTSPEAYIKNLSADAAKRRAIRRSGSVFGEVTEGLTS